MQRLATTGMNEVRDVEEETIPAIPSLQRRLKSSAFLEQSRWIPAFAGMTSEV